MDIKVGQKTGKVLKKSLLKDNAEYALLALPAVLLMIVFNYLPMFGIFIAFKDYRPWLGLFGSEWNGLENFRFFFGSLDAVRVIRNTLCYNIAFIILGVIFGVLLALMFYFLSSARLRKVYNTCVLIPKFMSMVLIAYIVQILLNPSNGVINQILSAVGMEKVQWYSEPKYWPFILTITQVWQTVGTGCILYYATLMSIDDSLVEASQLDGAGVLARTIYILIPHLKQMMILNVILSLGSVFSGDFGLFYQVPMDIGLLYPTTDIINTYTFRALQQGSLSKSAAVGLFQSVAGLIMIVSANLIIRKISPEDSLF